jgi:hypothetical protein
MDLGVSAARPKSLRHSLVSSVGETGPHGLTVRARIARLATRPRPSHSAPRFVTIAKRLFSERGIVSLNHNFFLSERKIFLRERLDIAHDF